MSEKPTLAWICTICGYIFYGPKPPEECPVCGAEAELFIPYLEPEKESAAVPTDSRCRRNVIVGAGIAGVSAAEALRKANADAEILLISEEKELPYYRLNLTRYLAGEITQDQFALHPAEWYTEHAIQLEFAAVQAVHLDNRTVTLQDDRSIEYDQLILTVGSSPFVPPIPGANLKNVTTLRTHEDADFILASCRDGQTCVCIGGGLLGLETAGGLARQGVDVIVLESVNWLLPRQLNETASRLLQKQVEALGIKVRTGVKIQEITGDESVRGVLLADGTLLPAGVVVISAGIRSNLLLAKEAGLKVNQGIVVDDTLQTSDANVFAAGDAAEHRGVIYGTWGPSQSQGTIAGMNAAGQRAEFAGIPRSNTLKVLGTEMFSIGRINPEDGDRIISTEDGGKYFHFLFRENQLVGAILLGNTHLSGKLKKAVENRRDFSSVLAGQPDVMAILDFIEKQE